jgi:NADH-quinone oxidoreductase subunit N
VEHESAAVTLPLVDLRQILPELIVTGTAIVVVAWALFLPVPRQQPLRWLAAGGVVAALIATVVLGTYGANVFAGMYARDALTQVLQATALVAALLALGLSGDYVARTRFDGGEFYALVLFAALGAMLMAASTDLLMLFVGFETLSIPLYVLAAFARSDQRSQEAGLKYFLLGAFSTAFFLYGIALLFGATGSTGLGALAAHASAPTPIFHAGVALLTVGLAFKAAVVPFHFWVPDVYEGAPLPVTAYMSVIAKIGTFAAMLRVFVGALAVQAAQWAPLLAAASVLTMVLGNLAALRQTSIKRLLAYSSIAHAGYILTGVVAGTPAGASAVAFYLVAYTFMTLGAFGVVLMLQRQGHEADQIADLTGLAWRSPVLGAAMTLFMISLAGFPLTVGFLAKFYVFTAVLDRGQVGVAVIGLLTSVVSAYYYLRVAYTMFIGQPSAEIQYAGGRWVTAALIVCAVGVLGGGIFPARLTAFVQQVGQVLR